ncbi:oxygen-independent coproporphyrinogen III oxidase [Microvirga tunisiensis]|uniref:Coproporphyrinogen-III oxidase n=1 Tax=Pannonibacter tanglangensis TaxID=2750084 RepID=A0A7X5J8R1_9HYPH|nr:oxygen-independent coproporphyrinogen III oxidase [Pannonibacter sp. XCT-53]NBN78782.1 oxygen-independent coproporphyrinogen III oxidase [Pannonibacter sp. XCT-53]
MSDRLAPYGTRNVPRYTSYPTAPHFNEGVDGPLYARWLEELPAATRLSLYLHVPFCRDICHYCGCHTKASRRDAPLERYAETLAREIELVGEHLGTRHPVSHIHWGGGTPSLLPAARLEDLASRLGRVFELMPGIEHAMELDPRHVGAGLARTLAAIGITRVSLGVQDMDDTVQKAIGRVQSLEVVTAATRHLRDAGLTSINFDLMYGLPHQSRDTILETVARTVELRPARIALFGYAHVPWMKKHQRLIDEAALPAPAERLAMAGLAREALIAAGYVAIGLDHFALPEDSMAIALADGSLKRNFQGYTTDTGEALVGFGVSSIGRLPQGHVQNAADTGAWERAIQSGGLPIVRGFAMSAEDNARADIIEQLMTDYRVDLDAVMRRHGLTLACLSASLDKLAPLMADGVVARAGSVVSVPEDARPYVRVAAAAFDAYLGQAAASAIAPRHSMAV